jgi:penicillin-binding protein-related factor A (putative recombinase)
MVLVGFIIVLFTRIDMKRAHIEELKGMVEENNGENKSISVAEINENSAETSDDREIET